jgi:hypothetical protein
MDIGAFGIDPASKFATEKCKFPKWKLALAGAAVAEKWAAIRSGSAGLDFQKGSLRFRFPVPGVEIDLRPCKPRVFSQGVRSQTAPSGSSSILF